MEPFDDVREFVKAKRFDLIFWAVLVTLLILFAILFFWVEHFTLTAKPGETITMSNVPSFNTTHLKLGDKDITIDYSLYENRPDFRGFLCKDGMISVNWPVNSEKNDTITVKNACYDTVTIEIYSYAFRILNAFLDASNGQLRTHSGSD